MNDDEAFFIGPNSEFKWNEDPTCSECGKKSDCCRLIYPDSELADLDFVDLEVEKCHYCDEKMDSHDVYHVTDGSIDDDLLFHEDCIEDYCGENAVFGAEQVMFMTC